MKKLFLFLTLLIAGITTNAQYTPYNNLNYMKLLKVPPIGAVEDSVLVYSGSDSFVKMRPSSVLIGKATATKTGTVKIDITEADPVVYTKTTSDSKLELETTVSAGAVSGFALTNNGNGTVNIASGIAYLRATNDPYATIIKYPISAVTNLALTDNANNYVLVDYNGGSPTLTVTTNASTINIQTNSLAFVIVRVGNDLEYLSLVGQNVDPNAKLRDRFLNQEGIKRLNGAVLGFSNRNLNLTSGVLASGLIRINTLTFNTASPDTFTLVYNNGSAWTRTAGQTQVNNTQYNVSGTLTTMPNNTFRTDYVYLLPNNPSKLYVVMGTTTYGSLTLAKGAPRPSSLPVELQVLGLEVGRLFIEKNSASITEVQSSFANEFVGASVPEHNSLSGLQGGTADQRNHLDNAQVTLVDSVPLKAPIASPTFTGTVSAPTISTSQAPTATAFTHYFGETGSDGIIRPKTLANVKTEIVTTAAVDAAKANIITGTGTANTIPKFTSSGVVGNSNLSDNGTIVSSSTSILAVHDLQTAYTGSFVGQGGNPSFVQKLERSGGSFAFTPLVGNAKNTTTNLTSKMYEVGVFGDLATGVTSPELSYFYLSVANDTYDVPSFVIFPNRNIAIGKTTNNGNKLSVNGTSDVNKLQLNTTPATASGTPPLLTWNSSTKDVESVPYATLSTLIDDASTATSGNAGKLRYRVSGNNSYIDIVMQTGASTYEWINIVQNNW